MKETVLITGGLGYIGARIAKHLTQHDHYQIILTSQQENKQSLPHTTLRHLNLEDNISIQNACKKVDAIIHLAASNEIDSKNNAERAALINTQGTAKLLSAAINAGVQKFIYFSTLHVYGNPLTGTLTEESNTQSSHPYAYTHKDAENFVIRANHEKNIKSIVLRLSNSFGPPAHPNTSSWRLVVNDLCKQAIDNKCMILKNANAFRNFITLEDVARCTEHFLKLLETQHTDNCLFNLGSQHTITIEEMAQKIQKRCLALFQFSPDIKSMKTEKTTPFNFNCDKLKSINFTPRNDFSKEIDDTLILCEQIARQKSI